MQQCNFNRFFLWLQRRQYSVVRLRKEKDHTWTGRFSSVHYRNRDFLLRTQNRSLVRPELIRSKDGMIDGDGGSASTMLALALGVFPVWVLG